MEYYRINLEKLEYCDTTYIILLYTKFGNHYCTIPITLNISQSKNLIVYNF